MSISVSLTDQQKEVCMALANTRYLNNIEVAEALGIPLHSLKRINTELYNLLSVYRIKGNGLRLFLIHHPEIYL